MPRKKDLPYNTDGDVFATRLREVMEERGVNQTQLSALLLEKYGHAMQRQTISLYMNGQSKPDTERLTLLCKALDVSSDYLLGLSEHETLNADIRAMCEYTGLSAKTLEDIHLMYSLISHPPYNSGTELDDLLRIYNGEIWDGLFAIKTATVEAADLLSKLNDLGGLSEKLTEAELPFYYADCISEHYDAEQTEAALQKSKFSQIDDEIVSEGEAVAQELELAIFRFSRIAGKFADIYDANTILDKLRATLKNQTLYRFNTDLGEFWADVLRGRLEYTAKGFYDTGVKSGTKYGEVRVTLPQDTTPMSARNIPSTAGEAQSGTPGGDSSPIEERQDGKHKEDKR